GFRLVRILAGEPLECLAVGLAMADVVILVDGLAIPDQGQFLPLERDLERLPLARRLREVLAGKGPLVEGAAVVEAELRLAVTVEDLDLEESTVVHARVAPLGDVELQVELVVGE